MSRPRHWHTATRITRPAVCVLAVLLLADGRYVTPAAFKRLSRTRPLVPTAVSNQIANLRRFGIEGIESRRGRGGCGYRLTRLPPDFLLEDVLAMAHRIKDGPITTRRRIRWPALAA